MRATRSYLRDRGTGTSNLPVFFLSLLGCLRVSQVNSNCTPFVLFTAIFSNGVKLVDRHPVKLNYFIPVFLRNAAPPPILNSVCVQVERRGELRAVAR